MGNNFSTADADKLKSSMNMVKEWTEHMPGWAPRPCGSSPAAWTRAIRRKRPAPLRGGIEEACDHAAKFGVILALENHGGLTATIDQTLALVQAVKHEWFGVNLDTGNFHTADPYADLAKLAPYAVTVQIKTEIRRADKKLEDADLKRLIDILRTVGYRGYVALEYEAHEDPKTAIPRHVETLKKLVRG